MSIIVGGVRSVGSICLGALVALISFGLLLSLAWLPRFSENITYKTISTSLVTAIAFILGGYIAGLLNKDNALFFGLALGLLLGTISFGYILGPDPLLLLIIPLTGLLGAFGGWLAGRSA